MPGGADIDPAAIASAAAQPVRQRRDRHRAGEVVDIDDGAVMAVEAICGNGAGAVLPHIFQGHRHAALLALRGEPVKGEGGRHDRLGIGHGTFDLE